MVNGFGVLSVLHKLMLIFCVGSTKTKLNTGVIRRGNEFLLYKFNKSPLGFSFDKWAEFSYNNERLQNGYKNSGRCNCCVTIGTPFFYG